MTGFFAFEIFFAALRIRSAGAGPGVGRDSDGGALERISTVVYHRRNTVYQDLSRSNQISG
jgi:hypothetical protein